MHLTEYALGTKCPECSRERADSDRQAILENLKQQAYREEEQAFRQQEEAERASAAQIDAIEHAEHKRYNPGDYICLACLYKTLRRGASRCPVCHAQVSTDYWSAVDESERREREAATLARQRVEEARQRVEEARAAAGNAAVRVVRRGLLHIGFLREGAILEILRKHDAAKQDYKEAMRSYEVRSYFFRLTTPTPTAPPVRPSVQFKCEFRMTAPAASSGRWTTQPVLTVAYETLDKSSRFHKDYSFDTPFEYVAVLRFLKTHSAWEALSSTFDRAISQFKPWLNDDWLLPTLAEVPPEPVVDYSEPLQHFREAAAKGDAESQHELGRMHGNGHGVPRDFAEAMRLYRLAATQGYAPSQRNIAGMYSRGESVPRDSAEALAWYQKAATNGDNVAMQRVGYMYANGEGVAKNPSETLNWYEQAANHGNAIAMRLLGVMHFDGEGVEKDSAKALEWYRKAADRGDAWAHRNVGRMYHLGQGVRQDNQEALKWYRKAAEIGDSDMRLDTEFFIDLLEGRVVT